MSLSGPDAGRAVIQEMQCLPGSIGQETDTKEASIRHRSLRETDASESRAFQQLKNGQSSDDLDELSLKLDGLSQADFTALPEFHGTVNFDLSISDKMFCFAARAREIRGLHEITKGDEITALEFKFFHE